jgi:hypothetical protein
MVHPRNICVTQRTSDQSIHETVRDDVERNTWRYGIGDPTRRPDDGADPTKRR